MNNHRSNLSINPTIFYPSILLLVIVIVYSLFDNTNFLSMANGANNWILANFGWLFTWTGFLILILLVSVYFSPIAKVTIGGKGAEPLLPKWKWFAIALCTTVATGILFWGAAEPLYHLHQPPGGLDAGANSRDAAVFAMSTMFMHWAFTPYGIYTITGLVFALVYYNSGQAFSISSLLYPLLGKKLNERLGDVLDIVCLVALSSGMAASLGTGIFALMGGLETTLTIKQNDFILGLIGFAVVATFILSAMSGLKKGITILSNINTRAFFVLAIVILIIGPTGYMLKLGGEGLLDYMIHFIPRSTNITSNLDIDWQNSWTIFYLANWFAWAPVAALFLGRLSVGYTVRDFINFNLIFPATFTCVWMMIFGGTSLELDATMEGGLFAILTEQGEENILFIMLESLPLGKIISLITLGMIFISYVTAADSNISAMSAISTTGINPENPEAPKWMKMVWGSLIGLIAWVMITLAGVDGIRLLCVLGGFPALFIIILVGIGMGKMWVRSFFE